MLKRTKSNLILHGVLFLLVGILCIATPQSTYRAATWIVGLAFIIAGVATYFLRSRNQQRGNTAATIATSIAIAAVGVVVIVWPAIIAVLIGLVVLVEGVDFIVQSLRMHRVGFRVWVALLIIGIVCVGIGLWAIIRSNAASALISIVAGAGCLLVAADCFIALAGLKLLTD